MPPQSDRPRRGEPHDDPERGHRVRPDAAAARDRDLEHGGAHGLPEPDRGADPAGVREHFRQVEREKEALEEEEALLLWAGSFLSLLKPTWPTDTDTATGPTAERRSQTESDQNETKTNKVLDSLHFSVSHLSSLSPNTGFLELSGRAGPDRTGPSLDEPFTAQRRDQSSLRSPDTVLEAGAAA